MGPPRSTASRAWGIDQLGSLSTSPCGRLQRRGLPRHLCSQRFRGANWLLGRGKSTDQREPVGRLKFALKRDFCGAKKFRVRGDTHGYWGFPASAEIGVKDLRCEL